MAYTYTPTGLRQSVTDGTGTTSYGYDALDRTVAVTNGAGQTVGYAYNPVDDTTAITYPGGVAVSRTFDALDRVTSLRDWLGHTTTYGYDPAGNPISETLPNTTSVVWGYDAADRLVGITRTAPLTAPRVYAYTRDGLGQLTGATDSAEPTAHGYGYTALNQLRSDTTGITYTASSANDLLGITSTAGGAPSTSSLGYDAAHELTGTRVLAGGVLAHNLTLAYNPDGDRTAVTDTVGSAATSYAYDQADRLVGVTSGGATSSYAYDGDGLRQGKTVSGVSSADTWDVSGSLPTLLQENGTRYIDGPNGQSIEQIDGSGNALYYYQDQLGSTRELADGSGHIAATYRYDAYGNPLTRTGTATTPFGYAGEYTDAETGLQYLRARYYDPATSQFLTKDPLVSVTGQPYAYATDNPLNNTDPTGQCSNPYIPPNLCPWEGAGQAKDNLLNAAGTFGGTFVTPAYAPTDAGPSSPSALEAHVQCYGVGSNVSLGQDLVGANELDAALHGDPKPLAVYVGGGIVVGKAVGIAARGLVGLGRRLVGSTTREGLDTLRSLPATDYPSSAANGARLAQQLEAEEAASAFLPNGELRPELIATAREIIPGSRLGNPALVAELTRDGSDIADWGKYQSETFRSPIGPVFVHFYYNRVERIVLYSHDYKIIRSGVTRTPPTYGP